MFATQLSALSVSIIVGALLPIVVGLVTKYNAPGIVKGIVNIVAAAIASLITTHVVADGSAWITQEAFVNWAVITVVSIATYLGVYGQVDANAKLAPKAGIGGSSGE